MTKKSVVRFLRKEENIEWLVALDKWLQSHIKFLQEMEELKKLKE